MGLYPDPMEVNCKTPIDINRVRISPMKFKPCSLEKNLSHPEHHQQIEIIVKKQEIHMYLFSERGKTAKMYDVSATAPTPLPIFLSLVSPTAIYTTLSIQLLSN